jgi:hypothetical protein
MASDGFRLWYQTRHAADAAPLPVAAKALSATEQREVTEWAARTDITPEKPKQGKKDGGVDMRTKKGRALKAESASIPS